MPVTIKPRMMLAKPNIKVKVEDDGDIILTPTKEPVGISQNDQLLVFDDYNKLTTELKDYGALETAITDAIFRIRAGELEVKV